MLLPCLLELGLVLLYLSVAFLRLHIQLFLNCSQVNLFIFQLLFQLVKLMFVLCLQITIFLDLLLNLHLQAFSYTMAVLLVLLLEVVHYCHVFKHLLLLSKLRLESLLLLVQRNQLFVKTKVLSLQLIFSLSLCNRGATARAAP